MVTPPRLLPCPAPFLRRDERTQRRASRGWFATIALALLILLCGCSTRADRPKSLGSVTTGRIVWSLIAVEDLSTMLLTGGRTSAPDSGFIQVEAILENLYRTPVRVTGATLVDNQGNTYHSLHFANVVEENDPCRVSPLAAGTPLSCAWIFEVPTSAQGLRLQTTDLSAVDATRDHLALNP